MDHRSDLVPHLVDPMFPSLWDGCVGAWCMSLGPTGRTLYDRSGFAHDGDLTNMDPANDWKVQGTGGHALEFDGTNDYVNFGNKIKDYLLKTVPFSISLWFYINTWVENDHIFNSGNGGSDRNMILLRSTNQISCATYTGSSVLKGKLNLSNPTGKWHHVVKTSDGGTPTLRVWVDGVEASDSPSFSSASGTGTILGARVDGSLPIDGLIDDFRIYNRLLDDEEVHILSGFGKSQENEGIGRGIAYVPAEDDFFFAALAAAVAAGRIDRTVASLIPQELPPEYVW